MIEDQPQFRSVYRRFTDEERARFRTAAAEEAKAMPANLAEARIHRAQAEERIAVFKTLKAERERQGLSLAEVAQRSGMDKGRLSKLENEKYPNVTLATIERYAAALGKVVRITLADAA